VICNDEDKMIVLNSIVGMTVGSTVRVLGEQVIGLDDPKKRIQALKTSTEASQVLIARSVVMQTLTLLSIRCGRFTDKLTNAIG